MSTDELFEKYYYSDPAFLDGTTRFHRVCASHITKGSSILEIGAGPTNATTDFLSRLGAVTGLDISSEVHANTACMIAKVYDGTTFPFASECFDACVSDYVLEHVENPSVHLSEIARVLRPNGKFCFRTPNLYHYVTVGSKLLPHGVHLTLANRFRRLPALAHDPWPTFYRCNSAATIKRLSRQAQLTVRELVRFEPEPSYGRISPIFFYPMLAYERIVNSTTILSQFRVNLLGVLARDTDSGIPYKEASFT